MNTEPFQHTPLFPVYAELGAKLIPFGAWELPVQFRGIKEEHLAVRSAAGIFDVSHMGEIRLRGLHARAELQRLASNDASRLKPYSGQYSALLDTHGGIMDDIIVYCLEPEDYLLCVNANNTETDLRWLQDKAGPKVEVLDESAAWAQVALQGPRALEILRNCADRPELIQRFMLLPRQVAGVTVLAAATGYTGEDGFELFIPAESAVAVWRALISAGEGLGLKPCGLGARDTLRLEMGYPLHGHDISRETTPLEAGLEWIVAWNKGDFIGREALFRQKQEGVRKKRIGFSMVEPGIPREGYPILVSGRAVGKVTSGTRTPSLPAAVGMGYVPIEFSRPGQEIMVQIREQPRQARVIPWPFYRKES